MMIGAHHAILLSYSSPSRKDLDLSSVRWSKLFNVITFWFISNYNNRWIAFHWKLILTFIQIYEQN